MSVVENRADEVISVNIVCQLNCLDAFVWHGEAVQIETANANWNEQLSRQPRSPGLEVNPWPPNRAVRNERDDNVGAGKFLSDPIKPYLTCVQEPVVGSEKDFIPVLSQEIC